MVVVTIDTVLMVTTQEQISRMQEVATHEWGLLQDLHGCMVDPGISLLERGYHDYKRHMDFVLSVQLDKVKLPMENEYIGGFKPGPEVIHTDQVGAHVVTVTGNSLVLPFLLHH